LKTINAIPIAHIDHMKEEKLGSAEMCEEELLSDETTVFKITGVPTNNKTVTILIRGSNNLVIEEAERSLHDAVCVVRSIVKNRHLVPGGSAPEIHISLKLAQHARTLKGVDSLIMRAYAEALEIIPYTLAENAGLNPIQIVTELKNRHLNGQHNAGISIRKQTISDDIFAENVMQPALVTQSAFGLATECVRMILKIDDLVRRFPYFSTMTGVHRALIVNKSDEKLSLKPRLIY